MDRFVEDERDRKLLVDFIKNHALPFVASFSKGSRRSTEQNRLQRLWCNEISQQLNDRTPEEVRGYLKLTIGVPILRADNEVFREQYDRVLKRLQYEQKLALMMEPLDLPVTRIMTIKQKTKYLDQAYQHFSELGVKLTIPTERDEL